MAARQPQLPISKAILAVALSEGRVKLMPMTLLMKVTPDLSQFVGDLFSDLCC